MTVYLVERSDDYDTYVEAVFATRDLAQQFCEQLGKGGDIREIECQNVLPPIWAYFVRGASVFPDKTVEQWSDKQFARGAVSMRPVDDDLNSRDEPWDGHTQQHCGEHIYISGTDETAVEAAFQKHLAAALARQDGICHSRMPHSPYIQTTARLIQAR